MLEGDYFGADADFGGLVGGEEGDVFLAIDEVALECDEMGGEEDVVTEFSQEGV